jgi:hypothetical protein
MVVNTPNTPLDISTTFLPPTTIDTHMAYVAQQWLDGYAEAVHHVFRRKAAFDHKVLKSKSGEVVFYRGQLIQVYCSDLAGTLSTEKKLAVMWSNPRWIVDQMANSYKLETLDGALLDREFSAHWLHEFIPRDGTELAEHQKEFMRQVKEKELERKKQEGEIIAKMRELGSTSQEGQEHASGGLDNITEIGLDGNGQGFFYDEDIPEEIEEGDGISDRVLRR